MLPQILPGGKAVLFTANYMFSKQKIAVVSFETNERKTLIQQGTDAHYLPSGHLLYSWAGDLLMVPFNLNDLKVTGPSTPVLQGIQMGTVIAHFSVSDNGTLVYVPGSMFLSNRIPTWVDHKGKIDPLLLPKEIYQSPRVSPDGKRLLVTTRGDKTTDIGIFELERNTFRLLTDEKGIEAFVLWAPDNKRVVFNSTRYGGPALNLFWKPVDGSGPEERLTESEFHQQPQSWSPDSKWLIFTEAHPVTGFDIWLLSMDKEHKAKPFLRTPFNDMQPMLSPDGRWIAYVSDESGRREVYVRSFPDPAGITQISNEGGQEPIWAPAGHELYYRDVTGRRVMAVSFRADPKPSVGLPKLLFEGNYLPGFWSRNYDLTPDGQRFLMIQHVEPQQATYIKVVLNWFDELKRIAPTDVK